MGAKNYTFRVFCSFEMQYTFSEDEVARDPGGDETVFEPKDEALEALELEDLLSSNYTVSAVDASADSNGFIGMTEEPEQGS